MNTRILSAAVVVSMFVLCQHVHAQVEEDPERAEATELEGTWDVVSMVDAGEQKDVPDGAQMRFEGDRIYFRGGDDGDQGSGTFSSDPSAMPPEIDIELDGESVRGIYEVDGDTLTICLGMRREDGPGSRPDRFESTEDNPTILVVLRRVEEESE